MAMFGQPKGDIMVICYHIWERKCGLIASNIDKAGLCRVLDFADWGPLICRFSSDTRESRDKRQIRAERKSEEELFKLFI